MRWMVTSLLLLASCANHQHQEIGKYVYVDCLNTIHVDKSCASKLIEKPKTKEERFANMSGVYFIDTCDLSNGVSYSLYKFCPRCVSDEAYTCLARIMESNSASND